MSDRIDAYAVLQVVPTAHPDVVRAAYRALARRYHPDRSPDPIDAERMIELNAAFELVGTPARRAAYDLATDLASATEADAASAPADEAPVRRRSSGAPGRPARGHTHGKASAGRSDGETPRPESEGAFDRPDRPERQRAAPPPAGMASGTVLDFGRYQGWTLSQIARVDSNYLEWFQRTTIGRPYRAEIEDLLHPVHAGLAAAQPAQPSTVSAPRRGGWLRHRR